MTQRFLHLTDIHLSHPEVNDTTLDTDTHATLEKMIGLIGEMQPRPDFIVASGDLTNRGHQESYELLADMMRAIDIPVFYALGNHDRREGFRAVFTDFAGDLSDPLDHDAAIAGMHLITLDTAEPGCVGGSLRNSQFDFLAGALQRHPELPKLLVLHHSPKLGETTGPNWTSLPDDDSDRLATMLKGQNVVGILSGHVHYNRVALWHGIPIVISNGQHASVDLLARNELRIVNGTGFAICEMLPGGLSASFLPIESGATLRTISHERIKALL